MSLVQTNPSDEQIIASAIIVDDQDTQAPLELLQAAYLLKGLSRYGPKLFVVRWPNGITATLAGDPSDKEGWNRLLVATYRQGIVGTVGPVIARAE